jgi:hypothetical protein
LTIFTNPDLCGQTVGSCITIIRETDRPQSKQIKFTNDYLKVLEFGTILELELASKWEEQGQG